jgi:DnaJ family protein C protein 28
MMASGIEEQIQQAIREGKFTNLPGQGKPMRLEENPFEDPDTRMANHILRSAGFTLPWIEKKSEIEKTLEQARQTIGRAWRWRQAALQDPGSARFADAEWQRAREAFIQVIHDTNKQIRNLNLEVPNPQFQLLPIDAERELQLTQTTASDTL